MWCRPFAFWILLEYSISGIYQGQYIRNLNYCARQADSKTAHRFMPKQQSILARSFQMSKRCHFKWQRHLEYSKFKNLWQRHRCHLCRQMSLYLRHLAYIGFDKLFYRLETVILNWRLSPFRNRLRKRCVDKGQLLICTVCTRSLRGREKNESNIQVIQEKT